MENNRPISPHIQIYNWHISSLLSISHRIVGIINIIVLTLICFWISSLLLFSDSYGAIHSFLNTFFGKFIIIAIIWSFIFQSLCEIRHLFWDFGYGFELKTSNITGLIVIFGSLVLTVLIFILGRNLL